MNSEKLRNLFDNVPESEYLEFESIPAKDRLSPSRELCGLLKLVSLLKKPAEFEYHAEHDILYLSDASDLKEITQADVVYLSRCGFHYDHESDCIADFC